MTQLRPSALELVCKVCNDCNFSRLFHTEFCESRSDPPSDTMDCIFLETIHQGQRAGGHLLRENSQQ